MAEKNIQVWLAEYSESHRNKINKAIHWVCVPLIFLTIVAFLWALPTPEFFNRVPYLNFASLSALFIVVFYIRLSVALTIAMGLFTLLCLWLVASYEAMFPGKLVITAAIAFVILWIGQFIGHHVEGKKPSFFQDIQFLMIGPAWVMAFIMRKIGVKY